MRSFRVAAVLAAVSLLAACARSPEIPFERASVPQITTIGVVTPGFPDGPDVILAMSIGQSFGLIGALVDAGLKSNRDAQFTAAMQSRNFSAPEAFLNTLTAGLEAEGYKVALIPTARDPRKFVENYAGMLQPPVDAYLDVYATGYGYIAAGIGDDTPYRPVLHVETRLVRATDRAILMTDRVRYNPLRESANVITIAPDPTYEFTNFDALIGRPDQAMLGLRGALEQSAQTICTLLK